MSRNPPKVSLSRPWIRALFCVAAAFIGAATADPFIERLSNAGVFGSGNFTDRSTVDVLPALAIGVAGAILWVLIQVRKILGVPLAKPDWLRRSARAIDLRSAVSLYPAILVLQIAILFLMETLEQVAVYGHVIGPLIWLGGPVAVSLVTHAFVCLSVTLVLHRILRKCSVAIAGIVRFVAGLFTVLPAHALRVVMLASRAAFRSAASPLPCRIGERAPPLSA